MASRKSTRHGASASTRRTGASARSGRGSSSRTRPPAKRSAPRGVSTSRPKRTTPSRSRAASRAPRRGWAVPLLVVAAVVLLGWTFYTPLKLQYQESREQARLQAELDSLKQRNENLSAQVERLKTPEGVEEVARESLGMVKEGENAYVVIDPAEEASAAALARTGDEAPVPDSVWDDVLDLVFGVR